MNRIHRFVTNDFSIRAASVDATAVVKEMQSVQNTYPLATIGVGRTMIGALLMASQLKEGQEVGVLLKGNGPLGSLYAEANFEGHVRGYCPNPSYQAPSSEDALNLGRALGFGNLNVTRHQPFQKQPFQGTVNMVSGEVGDDLAHYLHQSQQIRSLVSLGVYLDRQGKVLAAGGVIVEVMPGVEEEIVQVLEKNSEAFKPVISKMILEGAKPNDLVAPYLKNLPFTEIPHPHDIKYFCPCTVDRVKRALTTLGQEGLQEMIDTEEVTEVTCQICGRRYQLSKEDLHDLKEELRRSSLH